MNNTRYKLTIICVCLALPLVGPTRDAGAQGGAVMTFEIPNA